MRLSFSTNAFTGITVNDAVRAIGRCGYRGVEILADRPHWFADDVDAAALAAMHRVLDDTGLTVASLNANTAVGYYDCRFWEPLFEPSLANPEEGPRRWRLAYSKQCVDLAAAVGAPHVSITAGRPVPGVSVGRSLELLTESLRELLAYARQRNIRIGIEYEPGLLLENSIELLQIVEQIGDDSLGANLDLGHCRVAGEEIAEVVSRLGDRIFHVHLEDIAGRKHVHLIPGQGEMPIGGWLEVLATHGYRGFVTVELYSCCDRPLAAARQAFVFLHNLAVWES